MLETFQGELIYIWYYFDIQLRQILAYWILGMVIGSIVSVFAKDKIHRLFVSMHGTGIGTAGIFLAGALGILSPLCMYGTIPIAASFYRQGMREDWLAAFMMSSVLLNPQLMIYSTALGMTAMLIRLLSCYVCGVVAGLLVGIRDSEKPFFNFEGFSPGQSHDTDPNPFLRFLKNLGRNIKATGVYFLIGTDSLGNGKNIVYVNVMNNLSVDCDCDGNPEKPKMKDVGILASADPVALDQACVDLVYQQKEGEGASLVKRIESRNGLHTLEHAEEIGLGKRTYKIVNVD